VLGALAHADPVIAIGCDMPFVTLAAVDLLQADAGADAVVATLDGRDEPLFARWSRACAPAIRAQLARGDRKAANIFADLRTVRVPLDAHRRALANCNTPEDLSVL
jgi:molybdopterin-guanine dinucleotide biosynthesis protein A